MPLPSLPAKIGRAFRPYPGKLLGSRPASYHPRLETLERRIALSSFLCDDQFSFGAGTSTYKVPYCHNQPLDVPNSDVTRVIVAVHGLERTAASTYGDVLSAAQEAGADGTSLIIAPQFLNESDIATYGLPDDYLYWNGPWRDGAQSSSTAAHRRPDRVSSFTVVDDLLTQVADSGNFPNLNTVIVSGHSAGGQFVQHYAASSPVENHLSGDLGLSVRYVTMNPGSYLYLDPQRFDPLTGTFDTPTDTPGYDDYPYGLENVNPTQYPYVASVDADTIRAQYGQRQVVYISGENDIGTDHSLDTSPPAMLQGANRFERGRIFFDYLQNYYGPDVLNIQVRETVPGVGHDSTAMYASGPALTWLFGFSGPCCHADSRFEPSKRGSGFTERSSDASKVFENTSREDSLSFGQSIAFARDAYGLDFPAARRGDGTDSVPGLLALVRFKRVVKLYQTVEEPNESPVRVV